MSGLRILCLNYEYPPIGGGGGRACAAICEALVADGHTVRVQTSGMKHLPASSVIHGVEVVRTPVFRQREDACSVPEMASYLVMSLWPTLRQIRKWKPDVIHVHFAVPTGVLAWLCAKVSGVPYVLTAHLGDVPGGVPEQTDLLFKLVGPFVRPVWNDAAATTAVSRFVAALASDAYGIHPTVIPNGIHLDARPEIRLHSPRKILIVGRLSIQKNPLLAIEALSKIWDLAWECEILGDGPLRDEVSRAIRLAGLESRILLRGWQSGAQVYSKMQTADILLMPSLSEGMPVAAVEALNHGLAIVSGPIDGIRDVLDDGINGRMFALNPDAFASGLREVLCNSGSLIQMREASSRKAPEFDIRRTASHYAEILQTAAHRNAGSD